MGDYKITNIELVDNGNVKDREVHVTLDNGTIVKICACHESWEQYNATTDELYTTVDVADYYNEWLHGDEEPVSFKNKYPEFFEGYDDDSDESDYFDEITREDVIEFIKYNGINLFGDFVEDVAEALADEVLDEYNEAQDGDLQKAVRYVVLDKFGALV